MDIDFQALLESFLAESEEGLAAMEEALMALERRPDDDEAVATAFRVAHTLKGTAGMFEFADVERFAHTLEELLDRLRERSLAVTGERVSLLLQAVDALREMIPAAAAGGEQLPPAARSVLDRLERSGGEPSAEDPWRDPAAEVGAAEVGAADPAARGADRRTGDRRIADRRGRSLRVGLGKLNRLLDITGEISIARGRLAQMLSDPTRTRAAILESMEDADLLHRELQELVMKLRMVPIGPTFRSYRRTVRDLARAHGKVARLVLDGEDVEVDATVIEHLRDPLTHMVRNALDHGIELPGARAAAGKDPCGQITLEARHEAAMIVIELADDGAGLDRERLLRRGQAAGLVAEGSDPSEQEIDRLIFEPGLTTAERVSELSGRGVGMDVVRRNIEALRGSMAIRSRPGEGTALSVRLPLTLAIIDGLTVDAAGESYFIPLESVVESVELPPAERHRSGATGMLNLRGQTVPYVRLRSLFRLPGPPAAREQVVVVERDRQRVAGLVVDALEGQSQAVIKPLAKLFRGLPGISGSTILGDGRVAWILDVPGLLLSAASGESTALAWPGPGLGIGPTEAEPARSDVKP